VLLAGQPGASSHTVVPLVSPSCTIVRPPGPAWWPWTLS
jgi:hypothetical protein